MYRNDRTVRVLTAAIVEVQCEDCGAQFQQRGRSEDSVLRFLREIVGWHLEPRYSAKCPIHNPHRTAVGRRKRAPRRGYDLQRPNSRYDSR